MKEPLKNPRGSLLNFLDLGPLLEKGFCMLFHGGNPSSFREENNNDVERVTNKPTFFRKLRTFRTHEKNHWKGLLKSVGPLKWL